MSFIQAVSSVFRNYANFEGRARRSEYWKFILFNFLVPIIVWLFSLGIGGISQEESIFIITPILLGLYSLATIIPNLAVSCRRLHDIGKSGAYMFFVLIPVIGGLIVWVWSIQDGQPWTNQYGADPKGRNLTPYGGVFIPSSDSPIMPSCDMPSKPGHSGASLKKTCPHCGRTVDADSVFCSYCGKNTHEELAKVKHKEVYKAAVHKKTCVNCGVMIEQTAKFCPHCGQNADGITPIVNNGSKSTKGFSAPTDLD